MLESVDRAVVASGHAVRLVRVPTTLHGLAAALDEGTAARNDAVLADFELFRSLSDYDWSAGIPIAIEAARKGDRAFFWWLERQTRSCATARLLQWRG